MNCQCFTFYAIHLLLLYKVWQHVCNFGLWVWKVPQKCMCVLYCITCQLYMEMVLKINFAKKPIKRWLKRPIGNCDKCTIVYHLKPLRNHINYWPKGSRFTGFSVHHHIDTFMYRWPLIEIKITFLYWLALNCISIFLHKHANMRLLLNPLLQLTLCSYYTSYTSPRQIVVPKSFGPVPCSTL